MPDFAPEIYRKAAEVRMRQYESEYSLGPLTWKDFAPEVTEILDAVAADLGNAAAEKILAHMEASGPSVRVKLRGDAALKRHMRRLHFETAARIASRAFLTEEDTLRQVAGALERGDYVSCPAPEDSDDV